MIIKKNIVLIAMLPALFIATTEATRLYKVIDQYGNVSYQSRPAPLDPGVISEEKNFKVGKDESGTSLASIARKNPVVIYTAPNCTSCDNARNFLDTMKIPYTDKNAQASIQISNELKKVSGATTVPVIVIGKKVLTGYTKPWLESELGKVGYPIPKKQTLVQ